MERFEPRQLKEADEEIDKGRRRSKSTEERYYITHCKYESALERMAGMVSPIASDVSGLDRFEILPLNRSKSQIKALNRFVNRLNQMNQIK